MPKKVTMAVGDGVNDIQMMSEADIGVGVVSSNRSHPMVDGNCNEVSHCTAYSIGQFKHLRTLLLYHGRESYRKNSYVVLLTIYKNLLLMCPVIYYGVYSGFSGQSVFDPKLVSFFNIVFTCLPIIVYGACDSEYDKETLIKNPVLYEDG